MKIVSWFSCGCNSAVASYMTLQKYGGDEVTVARCVIPNEHPDNERFHADCRAWYGRPILRLQSEKYIDCWDVWETRKYISGIHGAPCTIELKKAVRWDFERSWAPDAQVFGFSVEEEKRAERFQKQNPDVKLLTPLIDAKLTKSDCRAIILSSGIRLPDMYGLGFQNNNCIGCAKATSIKYWARTRHYFPEQFKRMAELSRRVGCRLTRLKGERIFLDDIPTDVAWRGKNEEPEGVECGLLCDIVDSVSVEDAMAEMEEGFNLLTEALRGLA